MKIEEVDVVFISYAKTDELENMTRTAIETLNKSEDDNDVLFNVFVVESNRQKNYDDISNVTTIYTDLPFGYHRYLNIGRKEGKAKYVCLCNNDVTFEANWASSIIAIMEENPDILSASPYCPEFHPAELYNTGIYYGYGVLQQLLGFCIFQRRDIYNIIGDLDEDFEFWFCDNDYSMTLSSMNIKHVGVSNSIVHHPPFKKVGVGATASSVLNDEELSKFTYEQENIMKRKWQDRSE